LVLDQQATTWAEAHATIAFRDWICRPCGRKTFSFSSILAGIPKRSVTLFPLQIRQPRIARNLKGHIGVHDDIDKAKEFFGQSLRKLTVTQRFPAVAVIVQPPLNGDGDLRF
jgi:hypothetical protein